MATVYYKRHFSRELNGINQSDIGIRVMSVKMRMGIISKGPMRKRGWRYYHQADLSISRRNQWVFGDTERIGRTGWPRIKSIAYLNLIRRGLCNFSSLDAS